MGGTLIALAAGAKNLGTALAIGQITFAATVVTLMLAWPRPDRPERDDS